MPDYTREALRTQLRGVLGPVEGASAYWVDAELNSALQETLRTWNRLTGYWSGRVVLATTASQPFVAIPGAVLGWASRLLWIGKPLTPTSLFGLDQTRGTWQSAASGTPKLWAPVAVNLVALSPAPATSSSALTIDGVLATPGLASDAATVRLDEDLLPVLLTYARHVALFSLGAESWRESLEARGALWALAGERNARLRATDAYRRVLGIREQGRQKPLRVGSTAAVGVKAGSEDVG